MRALTPALIRTAAVALAACLALAPAGCADRAGFNGERAMADLKRQVEFGPRVPGAATADACREFLVAELEKTADSVEIQRFTHQRTVRPKEYREGLGLPADHPTPPSRSYPLYNIVATIRGTDGKPPSLLLCAHWDTRPTADREKAVSDRLRPIPGANDGASGVAVLLELARTFKAKRPTQGVIIALFDGEDLGPGVEDMLLGAAYYAKNPIPNKPAEGILLDMVGDADLAIRREGYSKYANKPLLDTIYATAARLGYGKQFPNEDQSSIMDDHVPLILAGINTVDLIDFDYPHWHTLADTPDKCSASSLEAVGRVVAQVVYDRK